MHLSGTEVFAFKMPGHFVRYVFLEPLRLAEVFFKTSPFAGVFKDSPSCSGFCKALRPAKVFWKTSPSCGGFSSLSVLAEVW